MSLRDYILEIEGCATAFAGRYLAGAPVSWATSIVEALVEVPPMQTMGVDIMSGDFQSGGLSVRVATGHAQILNRRDAPRTYLTAALGAADTTVTVSTTSGFPSSGTIWIEQEAITYTGTTATTFTGCTRARLGTTQAAHALSLGLAGSANPVYGYMPFLEGRRAFVRRYDPSASSPSATTVAAGFIDSLTWSADGLEVALVSVAQLLEEPRITSERLSRGELRGSIVSRQRGYYVIGDTESHHTDLFWAVDYGTPLAVSEYAWVTVGDELMRYRTLTTPTDKVITTGSNTYGPYLVVTSQIPWRVGDLIEFVDSGSGDTVWVRVSRVDVSGLTYLWYSNASYAPSAGDTITSVGVYHLQGLLRRRPEKHEQGSEIRQTIVLDMDHCDAVLSLLLSGNGSGSWYDVLPSGVGAGLSTSDVDVSSFDAVRPYSVPRRTVLDGAVTGKELLSELAQLTGSRIYIAPDGRLSARRDYSPYPDIVSAASITTSNALAVPQWGTRTSTIANLWRWPLADGSEITFRDEGSIAKYRIRAMSEPKSELLIIADSGLIEAAALSVLRRFAEPCPEVTVDIAHEETPLHPGSIVALTIPHLPDQSGNAGLSAALFEVIEWSPTSNQSATVRLLRLPPVERVGLVAPAGIVSGVAGAVVTIQARSTSHLAPSSAASSALSAILGGGTNGTEDAHWFLVDDPVQLIDVSTLGNTPPTTSTTTITAINYATRQITLAAVPGWLAAGDLIRLDTYATMQAGATASQRLPYFTAWSDATPDLPGGDEAYYWGM